MRKTAAMCLSILAAAAIGYGAPVHLPQTGQKACYDPAGAVVPCAGTGQDGEKQAGVPLPAVRFTDNADGTVTDTVTNLVWLKDVVCFSPRSWLEALTAANGLGNGQCGLSDKSAPGAWHLPNVTELESLVDLSRTFPAFSGKATFANFSGATSWTSSTHGHFPGNAWVVGFGIGNVSSDAKTKSYGVWPVRARQ